jgi:hypothetical protein
MVLRALRAGFASVRFHAGGHPYDPFIVAGGTVVDRPLYDGLRAAASVLTPGARMQAIPNAAALDGVTITGSGGRRTIVLSNYAPTPCWVALDATAEVRVLRIVAHAPTVLQATVAPEGGRVRVELPPSSVDAITLAPRADAGVS